MKRLENRREIFGWCMFDFANSSYTTVIVSVVYGLYFQRVMVGAHAAAGRGELLWGIAIAVTNTIVLLASPLLGAMADFSGRKKRFLFATYMTCVLATALLYLPDPGQIWWAMGLFIVSNLGFSFGENFTASFLPEIAPREAMGRVSGYGWGLGYIGGIFALALNAPLMRDGFTLAAADRLRWAGPITASFFALAAIPTFLFLRERTADRPLPAGASYLRAGWREIVATFRDLRSFRVLAGFLGVFFLYGCGLMSVIAFASSFAEKELGLTGGELLWLFLSLNLSSAIGALALGLVQDRIGAKRTILFTLAWWAVLLFAIWRCETKPMFFLLANFCGVAIGATQSASRSLVALLAPPEKSGQFFGFWGLFGKLAYAVGPLVYGIIAASTGSQRGAILATAVWFVAGFVAMLFVNVDRGEAEVDAWRARQPPGTSPAATAEPEALPAG